MKRALDLFCGVGGATRGLQMAGYHVTGVDIRPQPRYIGDKFVQADATKLMIIPVGGSFDLIWASPPCQAYTRARSLHKNIKHPELIEPVREWLRKSGCPYIIENVPGAPLIAPVQLCGSAFGLHVYVQGVQYELRRHRLFESNCPLKGVECNHILPVIGIYGHGESKAMRGKRGFQISTLAPRREVMRMPWASSREIAEAIPPVYSEYLARQILNVTS